MSDLVGIPEDRFSHNAAHILCVAERLNYGKNLPLGFLSEFSSTCIGYLAVLDSNQPSQPMRLSTGLFHNKKTRFHAV